MTHFYSSATPLLILEPRSTQRQRLLRALRHAGIALQTCRVVYDNDILAFDSARLPAGEQVYTVIVAMWPAFENLHEFVR